MAYSETLANRVTEMLLEDDISFVEKRMFGGLAFMINDKMCIGVVKDQLMLRVLDEKYEHVLEMDHAIPMKFTGKEMKGFVFVEESGLTTIRELRGWIDLGIEFGKYGVVKSRKK